MDESSPLLGCRVAITGRLASMSRREAIARIVAAGGTYIDEPASGPGWLLVVGEAEWPLVEDGRLTEKLQRARDLARSGDGPEIVGETEFLSRLGFGEGALDRLYTAGQLARILRLPVREITSWVRRGLLRPVKMVNRLLYFEFAQVAGARTLAGLLESGVPPERIRRSLELLEDWLPGARQSMAHLDVLSVGRALVVRLDDGSIVEPGGQLHIDFEEASPPSPPLVFLEGTGEPRTAEEWFERAVVFEEDQRFEEAADAYHESLMLEPNDPEGTFNLGNVLYALGRRGEAVQRYLQTVEIDADYVEAWNNLGGTLVDLGRIDRAIVAFERAISTDAAYADAHYNLAETLHAVGRTEEARVHWRLYLQHDPDSSWAERVRQRLRERDM